MTVDEDNGTVTVCLVKRSPTSGPVVVDVTSRELSPVDADSMLSSCFFTLLYHSPLTAGPSDFMATTNRVTFPAEAGQVCTEFPIVNDTIGLEETEDFRVTFNIVEGPGVVGSQPNTTVHIVDDDRKLNHNCVLNVKQL